MMAATPPSRSTTSTAAGSTNDGTSNSRLPPGPITSSAVCPMPILGSGRRPHNPGSSSAITSR